MSKLIKFSITLIALIAMTIVVILLAFPKLLTPDFKHQQTDIFSVEGQNLYYKSSSDMAINFLRNKVKIKSQIDLTNVGEIIDNYLKSKGNLGSYSNSLYYVGKISFVGTKNPSLKLNTKVRFEHWAKTKLPYTKCRKGGGFIPIPKCSKAYRLIKNKTFQTTKNIVGTIKVLIKNKKPIFSYSFNIKNFPGKIEKILNNIFDVPLKGVIDKSLNKEYEPLITDIQIEAIEKGKGIKVHITAESTVDQVTSIAIREYCLAKPDAFICRYKSWLE